jgi:P4 family phage/plasmid primase-like protien
MVIKQIANELRHISIARELCDRYHFKTLDKVIYRYNNSGLYVPDGEAVIESEAQQLLDNNASSFVINEVVKWIARETVTNRTEFDKEPNILNTMTGFIDCITGKFTEHTPDYPSLIQIPVIYEPGIDCPKIKQFFSEVLNPEDITVIEELFGYCLLRRYLIQKAFILVGEGSNGKSTLIELLRTFLGRNNCSSLTFQALEEDRFAKATLYMKLANLSSDIPSKAMHHVGTFKMLTGGDEITADRKFRDLVKFVNFAKIVFSANRPPKVYNDDSYAFWRRLIIIDFPNQFTTGADKNLLSKLTTMDELCGLLTLTLKGLKRLLEKGDFSTTTTPDEIAVRYNTMADPVLSFVNDCCELGDYSIERDLLFEAFTNYCQEKHISLISKESFGRNLQNSPSLKIGNTRLREGEHRSYAWRGLHLKDS